MTSNPSNKVNVHRKLLMLSASAICKEQGFECASKDCIESLAELLQAYLSELSLLCREFSELSHRTAPDVTDVKQALIELGSDINVVKLYALRGGKEKLKTVNVSKVPIEHKPFHSGLSRILRPSYIAPHLPDFPDVHAFVRTPTLREPASEYRTVREKVAAQRCETEASLVKFLARTRPAATHVFENINMDIYPQAEVEVDHFPYLRGLLPSQNDFLDLDDTTTEEKCSIIGDSVGVESVSASSILSPDSKDRLLENPYMRGAKMMKASRKST